MIIYLFITPSHFQKKKIHTREVIARRPYDESADVWALGCSYVLPDLLSSEASDLIKNLLEVVSNLGHFAIGLRNSLYYRNPRRGFHYRRFRTTLSFTSHSRQHHFLHRLPQYVFLFRTLLSGASQHHMLQRVFLAAESLRSYMPVIIHSRSNLFCQDTIEGEITRTTGTGCPLIVLCSVPLGIPFSLRLFRSGMEVPSSFSRTLMAPKSCKRLKISI